MVLVAAGFEPTYVMLGSEPVARPPLDALQQVQLPPLLEQLDDGFDQVVDGVVAEGGDADALACGDEGMDLVRSAERLAGPGRSLERRMSRLVRWSRRACRPGRR